jgi:hypothetical protein
LAREKGPRSINRAKPPIDYVLNPDGALLWVCILAAVV